VKNGNTGYDDIRAAIKEAKEVKDKPTLIKVRNRTVIFLLFFSLMQFYQPPGTVLYM
jgi:hypothetical protein